MRINLFLLGAMFSTTALWAQNVGIGQATPVSKLHVQSSTTSGDGVQVTNTNTGATATDGLKIGVGSTLNNKDGIVNQQELAGIRLRTNALERGIIDSIGNLGLNIRAPYYDDLFSAYAADYTGATNASTTSGRYAVNAYANSRSAIYAENNAAGLTAGGGVTAINYTGYFYNKGAAATGANPPTRVLSAKLGATNGVINASTYGITSTAMYVQNDYTNVDMAAWITNFGTGVNGAALQANNYSTTAGTNFFSGAKVSVAGQTPVSGVTTNVYAFGVLGGAALSGLKTAGTIGISTWGTGSASINGGGLGYWSAAGTEYGVYGFGKAYSTGATAGRFAGGRGADVATTTTPSSHIGLGINGTVMGGWLQGKIYGTYMRGDRFSTYTDGLSITNQPITQLVEVENSQERVATFASVSQSVDITAKGKGRLVNGSVDIQFDAKFSQIIDNDVIVTVTPIGDCNGVHLVRTSNKGFTIAENQKGVSNVAFTWIAIGTIKQVKTPIISSEILNKDFDTQMRSATHDDNDVIPPTPIWYDGTNIRFDTIPEGTIKRVAPEGMIGGNGQPTLSKQVRDDK